MLKLSIQGNENVFCMSLTPTWNCQEPSPGSSMMSVSAKTAAVTMSENVFIASPLSLGKNANTSAPAAGKKTIRLNSVT